MLADSGGDRNAAPAQDGGLRPLADGRHPGARPRPVRLRPPRARLPGCRHVHCRGRAGGGRDSRRPADHHSPSRSPSASSAWPRRHAIVRRLPAVETLGSRHRHLLRQDRHVHPERDDCAAGGYCAADIRSERGRLRASRAVSLRRTPRSIRLRRPSWPMSPASRCSATTLSCATRPARGTARGNSRATRPRAHWWPLALQGRPRAGASSRRPPRAWTSFRSNPSTASWRRCTTTTEDMPSCSSRVRRNACSRMCDRQHEHGADRWPWTALTGTSRSKHWPRRPAGARPRHGSRSAPGKRDLTFADVERRAHAARRWSGIIDPPREEAIQAVADCRRAGIRVKMITGDHAATAQRHRRASSASATARARSPAPSSSGMDDDELRRALAVRTSSPARARSTSCASCRHCRPRATSSP